MIIDYNLSLTLSMLNVKWFWYHRAVNNVPCFCIRFVSTATYFIINEFDVLENLLIQFIMLLATVSERPTAEMIKKLTERFITLAGSYRVLTETRWQRIVPHRIDGLWIQLPSTHANCRKVIWTVIFGGAYSRMVFVNYSNPMLIWRLKSTHFLGRTKILKTGSMVNL